MMVASTLIEHGLITVSLTEALHVALGGPWEESKRL
jgi:hypothetical protein